MRWKSTIQALCAMILLLSLFSTCAAYANADIKGVSSSTVINAPKETVWKVLTSVGNFDDKLQSKNGNEAVVEQKFKSLPMLSAITILVKAKATPEERLDFDMIKCDRLKAFSGNYKLTEADKEKTKVHLTMYVDPGLPVPRFLVNKFIEGKVKSRLRRLKNLVEKGSS
jgi:hypothetical protein